MGSLKHWKALTRANSWLRCNGIRKEATIAARHRALSLQRSLRPLAPGHLSLPTPAARVHIECDGRPDKTGVHGCGNSRAAGTCLSAVSNLPGVAGALESADKPD